VPPTRGLSHGGYIGLIGCMLKQQPWVPSQDVGAALSEP
jgi:hypothetical protein